MDVKVLTINPVPPTEDIEASIENNEKEENLENSETKTNPEIQESEKDIELKVYYKKNYNNLKDIEEDKKLEEKLDV